jgi:hypothetical protein
LDANWLPELRESAFPFSVTELKVSPRPVKLRPTALPGTMKEPGPEGVKVNVSVKPPRLWSALIGFNRKREPE